MAGTHSTITACNFSTDHGDLCPSACSAVQCLSWYMLHYPFAILRPGSMAMEPRQGRPSLYDACCIVPPISTKFRNYPLLFLQNLEIYPPLFVKLRFFLNLQFLASPLS